MAVEGSRFKRRANSAAPSYSAGQGTGCWVGKDRAESKEWLEG